MISIRIATLIGFSAIFMWALLGVLTAWAAPVPPFQLAALSMGIGALTGVASWVLRPPPQRQQIWAGLHQPSKVWVFGTLGLFGYHALYFTAMRLAPPVEANLINYLWPLLIVLFSALLPQEKLQRHHLLGAALGFCGTALIVVGGTHLQGSAFSLDVLLGYAAALGCAFVWAAYSVISRQFKAVPSDSVVVFCALSAGLSLICHLAFEQTQWPPDMGGKLAVLAIGVLPTGAAFYVWDIGMKHGNIQTLGVLSYATPLLSTGLLVICGFASPSLWLLGALILIVVGALLASFGQNWTFLTPHTDKN